jgi:hypothetical protein
VNLDQPLHVIASAVAEPGKPGLPIAPGRWHVLFGGRQRPLLMPTAAYRQQKRWLHYFVGGRFKSLYARILLKLNSLLPAIGLLPEFQVQRVADAGHDRATSPRLQSVIQIGTTGPYQKASVLLISERGEGLALAKVALVPSADAMVRAEANWLREVACLGRFADQVPQLLAEGAVANGRRYLVTSLAPSTQATTDFTPAHARFLRRLGRSRMEVMRFRASPCCEYLERSLLAILPHVARDDAAQLRDALLDCQRALSDFVGPFVFSQGDFAWWNIRLHPDGIFVFDWEYARLGANPLADLFHFHMMQRAAAGRSIGAPYLAKLMRRAQEFARDLYPETKWRAGKISTLALVYVLEVLLQYCRAGQGLDRTAQVIQEYWRLMERRSAWMAA